jgi:hypothetical protein
MDVFALRGKMIHRTLLTPTVGNVLLPLADPLPRLVIGVMVMRTLVGRLRTRQVAVLSPYPITYKPFSKPTFQPQFNVGNQWPTLLQWGNDNVLPLVWENKHCWGSVEQSYFKQLLLEWQRGVWLNVGLLSWGTGIQLDDSGTHLLG